MIVFLSLVAYIWWDLVEDAHLSKGHAGGQEKHPEGRYQDQVILSWFDILKFFREPHHNYRFWPSLPNTRSCEALFPSRGQAACAERGLSNIFVIFFQGIGHRETQHHHHLLPLTLFHLQCWCSDRWWSQADLAAASWSGCFLSGGGTACRSLQR